MTFNFLLLAFEKVFMFKFFCNIQLLDPQDNSLIFFFFKAPISKKNFGVLVSAFKTT